MVAKMKSIAAIAMPTGTLQWTAMDEMIDHCAQFVDEFNKDSEMKMTKEEAVANMKQFFLYWNVGKSLSIPDKTGYIRYSYIAGYTFCVVH